MGLYRFWFLIYKTHLESYNPPRGLIWFLYVGYRAYGIGRKTAMGFGRVETLIYKRLPR